MLGLEIAFELLYWTTNVVCELLDVR